METTNQSYLALNTKKYLAENGKTILSFALIFLGFTIVAGIWSGIGGAVPGSASVGIYVVIAGLMTAIAASLTFQELSSKEGRISFLMSPGTALQKYLPRVIATVIGATLLAVIGVYVLHASQIITHGFAYKVWLPWDTGAITVNEEGLAESIMGLIAMYLFNEGLFVFGSAMWPKKSFIKTMCLYILIQMVLSMIMFLIFDNIKFTISISPYDALRFAWVVIGFVLAIDFGLFYWAYRRIKTLQVV